MLRRTDFRYSATATATAAAVSLVLPVRIVSRQPTTQQALALARQVVEAFGKFAATAQVAGGKLSLPGFQTGPDGAAKILSIQQRNPKQSQIDIEFVALMTLEGPAEFWPRANLIAWAVDAVQGFSGRSWPKGIWVIPKRCRSESESFASEETIDDPPDE